MSGQAFDVFVVGAADSSAASQARLAVTLAEHLGVSPPAVVKGLADRKLRAGNNLDQTTAQNLVRDLKALGAVTVIRPSGGSATASQVTPPGVSTPGAAKGVATPGHAPAMPASSAPMRTANSPALFASLDGGSPQATQAASAPIAAPRPRGQGAPPVAAYDPFGTPPSAPALKADGRESGSAPPASAFAPPPSSPSLSLSTGRTAPGGVRIPAPAPAPAPAPRQDSFAATDVDDAMLELDTSRSTTGFRKAPGTLAGASGLNMSKQLPGTSSDVGLAVDDAAAGDPFRVRCGKHGLFFDSRRASACTKCLEPARRVAATIEGGGQRFKLANFGDDSARRAFVGLGIALVVGLIPAAYHALRIGTRDLRRLRVEQELLSRKPATDEVIGRFDAIDGEVRRTKNRAMRNTAFVWMVVSGGILVGWYRLT